MKRCATLAIACFAAVPAAVWGQVDVPRTLNSAPDTATATVVSDKMHRPNAKQLATIINRVMNEAYGKTYNAANGCWEHEAQSLTEASKYCMAPGEPRLVQDERGLRLNFLAWSRPDLPYPDYLYSSVDPGRMGAFEIRLHGESAWTLTASSPALEYGTAGDCGCRNARFVRLGRDLYGWAFQSGGMWQGVASLSHSLVAPRRGEFVDISEIPFETEHEPGIEYQIRIDESDGNQEVFPLILIKTIEGKPAGVAKVDFDHAAWRFALPDAR